MMSPLLVSVSAWFPRGDKFYRPQGMQDNHATTMFYQKIGNFRRVFDSYDRPHIKDVEWEAVPQFIQRYWIKKRVEVAQQISLIQRILNLMSSLLGLLKEETPKPPVQPSPTPVLTQPEQPRPYLKDFALAIQTYEGWFPPSAKYPNGSNSWRNKNPGNIKGTDGKFLKFETSEKGMKYLCEYIKRVQKNEHKAYPKDCTIKQFFLIYAPADDNNHPIVYGVWVAARLKVFPDFLIKNLI